MKPYKVRIEWQTVILARDQTHAMKQAESVIRDGDDASDMVDAVEIKSLEDLPPGWNKDCRPWGEVDPEDRTLGQMLPASVIMTVFYFGCVRQTGHYLWHPTEGQVRRMNQAQPWGNKIDGWVFKDSKAKDDPGVVYSAKLNGWTLVGWADRSVDSRSGSHSTFIVEADISPARLIELAREQWPQVFSRPGFPDLSNVEVTRGEVQTRTQQGG